MGFRRAAPAVCFFAFFFIFFFSARFLDAQVAAEMDGLLEARTVGVAQAARFTLAAADITGGAVEGAYALAREKGWLLPAALPEDGIRLGELCFLMMEAFNIKGSFLYALFPGPRYAFREFDYLKLLPGRRDPGLKVSGEMFLQILGSAAAYAGMGRETPPPEAPPVVVAEEETPLETPPAVVAEEETPLEAPPDVEAEEEKAAALAAAIAVREQIAETIQAELEQHDVADTTVQAAEEGIVISLNNIQFMPDSAELMETEKAKLREIALILSRYPERKILVAGHTAMAGTEEGRMRISEERAAAVADFLIVLGVRRREDITAQGYGAQRPLGDNRTPEGQALNRRVEIIMLDE